MTEAQFQQTVIDAAQALGWRVAHFRPAKTEKGWRTAVAADGKGFPDLVLVRDRVLFVELKTDAGKLSPDQKAWMRAFQIALERWVQNQAGSSAYPVLKPFYYHLWRPRDWVTIERTLRG